MALNGLFCADVPLRNYSLTHPLNAFAWSLLCPKCVCGRTRTSTCMGELTVLPRSAQECP